MARVIIHLLSPTEFNGFFSLNYFGIGKRNWFGWSDEPEIKRKLKLSWPEMDKVKETMAQQGGNKKEIWFDVFQLQLSDGIAQNEKGKSE